jgi:hypothetical protein
MTGPRRVSGIIVLGLALVTSLTATSPPVPAPAPGSLQTLERAVADAFRAHDPEAFLSLFCWDRVDAGTRRSQERCLGDIVADTLVGVDEDTVWKNPVLTADARAADRILVSAGFRESTVEDQAPILETLMAASRPAAYRWLRDALRDPTHHGSFIGSRTVLLQRREWTAYLVTRYLLPPDAGFSFEPDWPAERREDAVTRVSSWVEDRLAALSPPEGR